MKANELRIGNYVIGHDGRFHKVTASCIVAQSQYDAANALGYRSIPLTEEILLKCGFENNRISVNPSDELAFMFDGRVSELRLCISVKVTPLFRAKLATKLITG